MIGSEPVTAVHFFFQAEDGIRDLTVTGVQTCALPIYAAHPSWSVKLHYDNLRAMAAGNDELAPVASYSSIRRFFQAQGWRKRRRLTTRDTLGAERAEARLASREVRSYEAE